MKRLLFTWLITILPTLGLAQEVPESLRGIWAAPSCAAPEDTLVIHRGFYLWVAPEEVFLIGVQATPTDDGRWVRLSQANGYPMYLKLLADGTLRESYMPSDAPMNQEPTEQWETEDYVPCHQTLPGVHALLHGEAVAMFAVMDQVYGRCAQDRAACAQTLFDGVDVSGDGQLSPAELARLFRVLAYVAAVGSQGPTKHKDLAALMASSLPLAPLLASAIVKSFDYDNDGLLSMQELSQDRGSLIDQLESQVGSNLGEHLGDLKQSLQPLERLLENFGY